MGSTKALSLATMVVLGTVASAAAADLLPPPPMPMPAPMPAPLDTSGWYIRADVGVGILQQNSLRSSFNPGVLVPGFQYDTHEIADTVSIGGGLGYQFNNWFRGDVTAEYRTSAAVRAVESYDSTPFAPAATCGIVGARCPDVYTGTVASAVFLANGYVDVGTWYGMTPYLGAGVGLARHMIGSTVDHSIGNTGGGYSAARTQTNLAWALMAGVGYSITPNLKLDLGYRYLDMGRITGSPIACQPAGIAGCALEVQSYKLTSHDIRLGLRYMFAAAEPAYAPVPAFYAPPPGPLVRKY